MIGIVAVVCVVGAGAGPANAGPHGSAAQKAISGIDGCDRQFDNPTLLNPCLADVLNTYAAAVQSIGVPQELTERPALIRKLAATLRVAKTAAAAANAISQAKAALTRWASGDAMTHYVVQRIQFVIEKAAAVAAAGT